MSIGNSGRIVIEIEPKIKQELHTVLRLEGTNLKAWFLTHVEQLLEEKGYQAPLVGDCVQINENPQ